MKILFFVLLGITLVCSQDIKQVESDSTENNQSALKLYLVNGISLAYKKEINSNWAWQLKFDADFDYNSAALDRTWERIYADTLHEDSRDTEERFDDTEGQYFEIKVQWSYNFYKIKKLKSYFGVGPLVRYDRVKNLTEYNWTEINGTRGHSWFEIEINTIYIGTAFLVGIEGKLLNNLSIFAEYELQFRYGWIENIQINKNRDNDRYINSYDGVLKQIELENIKLGLILYL